MTVVANDRIAGPFVCTGGETVFSYDFKILSSGDITVKRLRGGGETVLVLGADYAVSGVGNVSGGNVTLTTAALDEDEYTVIGARPHARTTDLVYSRALPPATMNPELDSLQIQIAEIARDVARAVKRSPFDTSAESLDLPLEPGYLKLGSDGGLTTDDGAGGGGGGPALPVSIANGGTGADTDGEARTNLGVPANSEVGGLAQTHAGANAGGWRSSLGLGALATRGDVATAHIQDDAVTLAKMAGGTANYYIGYDGSGNPSALAPVQRAAITKIGKNRTFGGGLGRVWVNEQNQVYACGAANLSGYGGGATAVPVRVAFSHTPATISKIVVGAASVYILDANGRVYSFGNNASGQLGHNDTNARTIATRIETFVTNGLTITDVAASGDAGGSQDYALFLTSTGAVWGCGANGNSQLGDGSTTQRNAPVSLTTGAAQIACAGNQNPHSALVTAAGAIAVCGYNGQGQLGLADTTTRASWTNVTGVTNVAEILLASGNLSASFGGVSIIRKTDGTVWSCGYNGLGALGLGDTANRSAFVQIGSLSSIAEIAMNSDGRLCTVAARTSAGNVYVWGYNGSGACGTGNTTDQTSPQQPSGAFQGSAAKIRVSGSVTPGVNGVHVATATALYAAGYAGNGNLGVNSTASTVTTFAPCFGIDGTIAELAGVGTGATWGMTVLYADGRTAVCGDNSSGQLGLATGALDCTNFHDVTALTPLAVPGAPGGDGDPGADGNTVLYGTAAPTTEGVDGDFYIRTTTNYIYGPKASGAWPAGVSLVGPTGAPGPNTGYDFAFDTGTADANPGAGNFRLNHATPGSATFAYVSKTDRAGNDIGTEIGTWDDSSNTGTKLVLRVWEIAAATKGFGITVTGTFTDATTYWKIPIATITARTGGAPSSGGILAVMPHIVGNSGAPAASARELLSAARTYYVRTDGSDSNAGLANTSGGAFLTIQKAIDIASSIDTAVYDITIQIAAGTYATATGNVCKSGGGGGKIIIVGDETTPGNVIVDVTGAMSTTTAIFACSAVRTTYSIRGVKLTASTATGTIFGMWAAFGSLLEFQNVQFAFGSGALTVQHVRAQDNASVSATGDYSILNAGATTTHYSIVGGGIIRVQARTITLAATLAFANFAECVRAGIILANSNTYDETAGAATGSQYNSTENSVIYVAGAGAGYFPGNVGGATATGGQYV